jgi:hypothetical protein
MVIVWWVAGAVMLANLALAVLLTAMFAREERRARRAVAGTPRRESWELSASQLRTKSDLIRIIAASADLDTAVRNVRIVFPEFTAEQARAKVLAHAPGVPERGSSPLRAGGPRPG